MALWISGHSVPDEFPSLKAIVCFELVHIFYSSFTQKNDTLANVLHFIHLGMLSSCVTQSEQ